MDRKKAILIAVFINAGLLAVLFIAALTTQDDLFSEKELVEHIAPPLSQPLFQEPIALPTPPLAQLPEEPVIHKLPPLAAEVLPIAPPAPASAFPPSFAEIAVKKGDTLDQIAKEHRTTIEEIIRLNQLPSSFLRIGQILKVPIQKGLAAAAPKPKAPLSEKAAGPEYYTVKVGDNPWIIANKHQMKVDKLLKLNNLDEEKARKIKPGDRLRVK